MSKKLKLPKGALTSKYWNIKPENESAFYTFQSQRYFLSMITEHVPEARRAFMTAIRVMELIPSKSKFTGWKALANEWAHFLNAMIYHDDKRFFYHMEANAIIKNTEAQNFGVLHRALNIAANQMDHMSFREALELWKTLCKEQPKDFRYFITEYGEWEWDTPNQLVDSEDGTLVAEVDDSYWLSMESNPSRDFIPMMSVPLLNSSSCIN